MSLDPNEKKSQSIRRGLILLLMGLQLVTVLLILFTTHFSSNRDIDEQISALLKSALSESKEHTRGFLEPSYRAVKISADLFSKQFIELDNETKLESYFLSQLQSNTEMTGMYVASPKGDFHYVTRRQEGEQAGFMTKVIKADAPQKASFFFRDESLTLTEAHRDKDDSYNALERPWYRQALDEKGLIWTEPYIFYTSKKPGITVASPFYHDNGELAGIVGVDVELTSLSHFLAKLKIFGSVSVSMVSDSGNFVATPSFIGDGLELNSLDIGASNDINFGLEKKAISHYLSQSEPAAPTFSSEFFHESKPYAIRYEPFLLSNGPEWVISAYAPKNTFLAAIRSGGIRNTMIALFILVLSLVVGWFLIRRTWQPFEHFFHDVVTDQLTGLFNRRFLENIGSRMYIRLLRNQHEYISIAVIDLDFFSRVNSEYGESVGHKTLIAFADFLKKTLRPEDIITRYSGDTFVVIFPGLNNEKASYVVDRMRLELDAWPLPVGELLVRLSFSAGIETIDKTNCAEDAAFSDFIKIAKETMKKAKADGRDIVLSGAHKVTKKEEPVSEF